MSMFVLCVVQAEQVAFNQKGYSVILPTYFHDTNLYIKTK